MGPAWGRCAKKSQEFSVKSLAPLHFRLQGPGPGTASERVNADTQFPHHGGARGGHSRDLWGLKGERDVEAARGWGEDPERGPGSAIHGYWYSRPSLIGCCSHSLPNPIHIGRTAGAKPTSFRPADCSSSDSGPPSSFLPVASCGTSLSLAPGVVQREEEMLWGSTQANGRTDVQNT